MPADTIPRDRYGRPLVEGVPYTRVSTLAKVFDDTTNLTAWLQRELVKGLGQRSDLVTLARSSGDDKRTLNDIVEQAMVGSLDKANIGTALHTFTEILDDGGIPDVPAEFVADVQAYKRATAGLTPVLSEGFVRVDEIQSAGSFDRIWDTPNGRMVGDLKTGQWADKPAYQHAIAMQLAIYAHGDLWEWETGTRTPLPEGTRKDVGLLVHMPAGKGKCSLIELDLEEAWDWVLKAIEVRAWKKTKVGRPVDYAASTITVGGN